jgi:hypothetical protein
MSESALVQTIRRWAYTAVSSSGKPVITSLHTPRKWWASSLPALTQGEHLAAIEKRAGHVIQPEAYVMMRLQTIPGVGEILKPQLI